jgi:hypothetical protein
MKTDDYAMRITAEGDIFAHLKEKSPWGVLPESSAVNGTAQPGTAGGVA